MGTLQKEIHTCGERLIPVSSTPVSSTTSFVYFSKLCFAWDSNGQGYDDFADYFERTWLNGNFSLSQWNVHLLDGSHTNNLEGWHCRVKTLAGKAHLNIFEMVELFKTEQSHMEVSILQLAAGGTVRRGQAGRERKKE